VAGNEELVWNPYDNGYFENPFKFFEQFRGKCPVHKGVHNEWMFFNGKDVETALTSDKFNTYNLSEFFKKKEDYVLKNTGKCPFTSKTTEEWPMHLNGAEHKANRTIIAKSLDNLELNEIIEESLNRLFKKYQRVQQINLPDFCTDFQLFMVEQMFDLSDFDSYDSLKTYCHQLAQTQESFKTKKDYQSINEWALWGQKIFKNSKFKTSLHKQANDSGLSLNEEQLYSLASVSLVASFETTKESLALFLLEAFKNGEVRDAFLNSNKQQLSVLIDELLRYLSPVNFSVRVNKEAIEVENNRIPENSNIYLSISSTNRDEQIFDQADKIITDRQPNKHFAFGRGIHYCIGANIVKEEFSRSIPKIISFLADYTLDKDSVKWQKQTFIRAIQTATLNKK
jgi:cytochrome P450